MVRTQKIDVKELLPVPAENMQNNPKKKKKNFSLVYNNFLLQSIMASSKKC